MNCGSGGVKYQLYAKKADGTIVTLGEFKPAQKGGTQPPALFKFLTCGSYTPTKGAVTVDQLHKSLVIPRDNNTYLRNDRSTSVLGSRKRPGTMERLKIDPTIFPPRARSICVRHG